MNTSRSYTYEVSGTGSFPIDMLRYDRCSPAREADSAEIARSFNGHRRTRVRVTGTVKPPTIARWKSFGWTVEAAPSPLRSAQ
jgi:hypothetical protein